MQFKKFEIHNFKNLEAVVLNWEDISILIGENNTGKSSVLLALQWFLSGKQIKDKALFRNEQYDSENAIELIGFFDNLSESEKLSPAIQGRMSGDEWILKKRFWMEVVEGKEKWQECYYSYSNLEQFAGWPSNTRSWNNWPKQYSQYIEEVKTEIGRANVSNDAMEMLKIKIRRECPDLISSFTEWVPNPGGGGNWKSNANSVIPEFIYVPAVHEVSSETSAKEATTYGRLINLLIEEQLYRRPEFQQLNEQIKRVQALFTTDPEHPDWQRASEIDTLEQAISTRLSQVIDAKAKIETSDINISSFILPGTALRIDDGFLTEVEAQGHGLQRTLIITLLQLLNEYQIQKATQEDGESSTEAILVVHEPEVHLNSRIVSTVASQISTRMTETSTTPTEVREQQKLQEIQKPVIFGIEEPEIYLHPQMVRKMKDVLVNLSQNDRYQVICTTHSPVFIDMADNHRSVIRLEKDDLRKVSAFQVSEEIFTGNTADDERQRLRMVTEFDASVNELFFAKRVVLVEGDTELAVLQKAADLFGVFSDPMGRRDITFINCHGKTTMPLFIKVLNNFKIKYAVVHDIDKGKAERKNNDEIAREVNDRSNIITFHPNIERVLGYPPSGKDKPINALRRLLSLHSEHKIPSEFEDKVRQIFSV